mgnify:CR=1 FL=1
MNKILGISAFYHDSAAALTIGEQIIAASQEERFTREKHTSVFPKESIKFCLEEAGLSIDELDAIVFYDKPLLKFERLLETYYTFAPKGLKSFLKAIPVWLNEKMFLKKMIYDGLKEVEQYDKTKVKLLFSQHHLSHASSAFFASPYHEGAILTIDGVGEWNTTTISLGKANTIKTLSELNFPHSVGLLYSAFTYFLGFKVNSGEYKLMGLAPYGDPNSEQTKEFVKIIKTKLVDIKENGSIWVDQHYFSYATGLKMIKEKKWEKLFSFPTRKVDQEVKQHHCNLAFAIQQVTDEIVIKMAKEAKRLTNSDNLCMAGGVALNCVSNGKLLKEGIFKNIYIQPAAGDAGAALGAAMAVNYMYFESKRTSDEINDKMNGTYLGPEYSDKEIRLMSRKAKAVYQKYTDFDELTKFIAMQISNGSVVGWFQDKMEFGPRALGNRSILADARIPEMQKKLNLKIKYREDFRPFAPSVLEEDTKAYFDIDKLSPYMVFVAPILEQKREPLPPHYFKLPLKERLYYKRSAVQSITHLDFSARIQTVQKTTNPKFWNLINAFKEQTGCPLLINTSFNVRGEPIVCTPKDAYRCFMSTEMDYLVINNFVYCKTDQVDWENKEKWVVKFKKD